MKIHYFQRYYSKENVVTSNTMLMLSRLYNYDSAKFFTFLNTLILKEPETPEITFDLQVSGEKSVPDAVISQKSFKVVVETKLYNQFNLEQLKGHMNQFGNEEIKVLLSLDPNPMSSKMKKELEGVLFEYNKTCTQSPIRHVNLTFKELLEAIEEVVDKRDKEMLVVFEDFNDYCFKENLILDGDRWMRAVAVWETLKDNIDLRLYYDSERLNPSAHGYIGLYSNKSVRAVGKLQKTIILSYEGGTPSFKAESNEPIQEDEENRILNAVQRAEKLGYDLTKEPQRFFLVDEFFETNYPKTSKYPIRKDKRFNLSDLLGKTELPSPEQIAQQLSDLSWE